MKQFITHSPSETEQVASQFAQQLKPGDVIAYRGGLGVGKTAFTRGLAEGLQVIGEVSSPTFSLVNEYQGKIPLYHFDMYRVESSEDLFTTGYYDYLDEGESILAVEWSENITDSLPEQTIYVNITPLSESERKIQIIGGNRF